jgi:hypothetical protein
MDDAPLVDPLVDLAAKRGHFLKGYESETQNEDDTQKVHFLMPPAPLMRVPQVLHPC